MPSTWATECDSRRFLVHELQKSTYRYVHNMRERINAFLVIDTFQQKVTFLSIVVEFISMHYNALCA